MGVGSKFGRAEDLDGVESEFDQQDPAGGKARSAEALGSPETDEPDLEVPRWSTDVWNPEECALACCCPCIVVGKNVQHARIGSFLCGCFPVGLLTFLCILFFVLPYFTDTGACSFPSATTELDVTKGFFGGKCSTSEYVSIPFTRIFWFCFAFALNFIRRRLAKHFGIRERVCPSLIFQFCFCYACLLATEARTVREAVESHRKHTTFPKDLPIVGDSVVVQAV